MKLVSKQVGRISMRMEPAFWEALDEICAATGQRSGQFVGAVDRGDGSLTEAVRVAIMLWFRAKAKVLPGGHPLQDGSSVS